MAMTHACPDLARYQSLASGLLSSPESEALLNHLAGCDSCVQRLEGLSQRDTLVELIRQARTEGDPPGAETVARLVERLRKLKLRPNAEAAEEPTGLPASAKTAPPVEPANSQSVGVPEPTGPYHGPAPDSQEREFCECLAPAQAPDELGRLGPYRVLQVLGAGGMGVVFRAEDPQLKRPVALKAMLPTLGASESARKRFLREAQAAAAISHDNIVHIYQVGEDRGVPFMAMQFLDGESLEARLKRERRLPTAEVVRIGRETAEGLASAHERGLIHRDVKPANLWLAGANRRIKILDFGLARAVGDEAHLTQTGAIVGTPAYMAPEQASAKPVDHRCDLFSLGCVLYRMTTGEKAFKGSDTLSILAALAREDPPAPASLNPEVPAELSDLVLRLLQKDPAQRPASAHEVVERLTAIERTFSREPGRPSARAGKPPASPGDLVHPRHGPPSNQRRIAALIAAAVVLLGGIVTAALVILRTPEGDYVIETDDPDFVFQVNKDGGVTLEDRKTKHAYQMKVLRREKDEFDLHVADDTEQVFETKTFTIKRGEKVRLKAWFAGKQDASPSTQQGSASGVPADAWMREVAAMQPDRQVKAVMDKLKALNPGFDGKETHVFDADGDTVIELHFCTDQVADLSPVRALTSLQKLTCAGTENWKIQPQGKPYSLSALKGLKLTWLNCSFNGQLSGLGPLKGMPLTELHCNQTKVSDLSPLKGMKLRILSCKLNATHGYVSDLSPLEGMPLEILNLECQSLISDLSPLAHTRLRSLDVWYNRVRDLSPLKGLPLERLSIRGTQVSDLTPLQNMQSLKILDLLETPVKDLSALEGLRITFLNCGDSQVSDLTPLKGIPLEVLDIVRTKVADLSPLKHLPLKYVNCDFKPERDDEILRSIKTLATINDKPAERVLGVSDAWVKEVSAKPGPQQLKAVMDKLKDLNPVFDGKETHAFDEAGKLVTELNFCTDKVTDISPVRALTKLQKLRCTGTVSLNSEPLGQLYSLSALKGLQLTLLDCDSNGQLSALGPLKGMPLTELHCNHTKVSDLSPLKGMKLKVLSCRRHGASSAYVADLSPLEGMPLEELSLSYQHLISDLSPLAHTRLKVLGVWYSRVRDLSPLKGLPLEYLGIRGSPVTDLTPLKNMQSLKHLDILETPVQDLSALEGLRITHLQCSYAHIKDLSALQGLGLIELGCDHTQVSDLTPLKGMPLKALILSETKVSDLTPLKGMPLEYLATNATKVSDLSLLKDMPLKKVWCDFKPERDAEILRSIKTLETINDKPAKEVLK
jgi:serine/threonine protein kinase/Leucine-rich repeat (LRR) protein